MSWGALPAQPQIIPSIKLKDTSVSMQLGKISNKQENT